ncbi:enoyl-CoA hydratase [soil metagenome]
MTTTAHLVNTKLEKAVAFLELNDPDRRNVLSVELSRALADAVVSVLSGGAGAIVLTAAPPVFSAGGDINVLTRAPVPFDALYEGFLALADAPIPTLAIVDGPAIGAGVNFALACDVVIATPRAIFDPRFVDVGIHPGGGHLWRLHHRVGPQAAAALALFGETMTGEEAVAYGLAWQCLPSEAVLSTARRLASRAASRDQQVLRRTKETLRNSASMSSASEAVVVEREAQEWAVSRPEFHEHIESIRQGLTSRSVR